ncbi:MAG: hypothetical protein U0X20_32850 [Caldilineaceae bacterium]
MLSRRSSTTRIVVSIEAADETAADAGDGVAEGYILGRVDGILFTQQVSPG